MKATGWLCVLVVSCVFSVDCHPVRSPHSVTLKQILVDSDIDLNLLQKSIQALLDYVVKSRDLDKFVALFKKFRKEQELHQNRQKRQSNFGGLGSLNSLGQLGGLGSLGSLSQLGGLGSLNQFGSLGDFGQLNGLNTFGQTGGLLSALSGNGASNGIRGPLNAINSAVTTVNRIDSFRCIPRFMCEFAANGRLTSFINGTAISGLVNSTLPAPSVQAVTAAADSLNLQNPSTFNSLLGILKFLNFHQQPTYPHLEAALHGFSHRDQQRCRNQFRRCPANSDAFIDQLNDRPGGVQAVISDITSAFRPDRPQVAANVAETGAAAVSSLASGSGGGFGGLGGLGALGALSNLFGGSGLFGGGNGNGNGNGNNQVSSSHQQQQLLNSQLSGNFGNLGSGSQFGSQFVFNPATGTFSTGQLNSGSNFAASSAANQQFVFNPATGTFTTAGQLNPSGNFVSNGQFPVRGIQDFGSGSNFASGTNLASSGSQSPPQFVYNPSTGTIQSAAEFNAATGSSAFTYNPSTGSFSAPNQLPHGTNFNTGATFNSPSTFASPQFGASNFNGFSGQFSQNPSFASQNLISRRREGETENAATSTDADADASATRGTWKWSSQQQE